jgi:HAD superfamily phosphatase (TIGR01668 family)
MDIALFLWYNNTILYEIQESNMSLSFLPTWTANAVTDETPEFLHRHGIHLLMLDFDNTIVPYTTDVPTEKMEAWLKTMLASEIQLCVVSNSKRDRVKVFCQKYGLDCITHAKKPFTKGIRACLAKYNLPAEACALAGDQIYTDTLGANNAGCRSILVKAIDNHNFWLKARHVAELPFIFVARKRRIVK